MFKAHAFAIASIAILSASVAFAGAGNGKDGAPGRAAANISWEEFRARCANPDSFDNQRAPREIKLQCSNVEREYVQDAPGTVEMPSTRRVITTVLSDKFNVSSLDRDYPAAARAGSCLRYKEIEKSITIERPMTCDEVLGIKGEISDYCASALEMAKSTNPKLIDVRDVPGSVRDTCGGGAVGKK